MWKIVGNNLVIKSLQNSVPDKLAQSYLFSGTEHIGKFTAAKKFAKSIQCQAQEKDFCGKCFNCLAIEQNNHPDIYVIKPDGEKKKEINIKTVRQLQRQLVLYPHQGKYKIAIIKNAHKMNLEASNAILKTLEEPLNNVILILTTAAPKELLPTILSRCRQYNFLAAQEKELKFFLAKQVMEENKLKQILSLSQGRTGIACNLLLNEGELKKQEDILDDLEKNIGKFIVDKFGFIDKNCDNKEKVIEMLNVWSVYFRDVLLCRMGLFDLMINIKRKIEIEKFKDKYEIIQLKNIIKNIEKTILLLSKTNTNTKLALEVLMLKL